MRLDTFLVSYSDSSFTNPHEVLLEAEPENRAGQFTHMGAQYWGFETRRHDAWAVDSSSQTLTFDPLADHEFLIGLKAPSRVEALRISTRWFTGNQVPAVSVELMMDGTTTRVIDRHPLAPDSEITLPIPPTHAAYCRVICHQEGGISRVSLFGEPLSEDAEEDNLLTHATITSVSNAHYGHPTDALSGRRIEGHMKGWESARGSFGEHAIFSFAEPIVPRTLVVDTYLHRLNAPLCCFLFGLPNGSEAGVDLYQPTLPGWQVEFEDGQRLETRDLAQVIQAERAKPAEAQRRLHIQMQAAPSPWISLTSFTALKPDTFHALPIETGLACSALLFAFFPNGGIHGLRVYA